MFILFVFNLFSLLFFYRFHLLPYSFGISLVFVLLVGVGVKEGGWVYILFFLFSIHFHLLGCLIGELDYLSEKEENNKTKKQKAFKN